MSGALSLLELSPSLLGNGALAGGFDASSAGVVVGVFSAGLLEGEGEGASGTFDAGLFAGVGASGTLDTGFLAGVGASGTFDVGFFAGAGIFPDFAAGLSPGNVVSVLRFGS
jgi:hypothetical protein